MALSGTKKSNGRKVYPDANHQPRQKAAQRKMLSDARQTVYGEMSLEQKIAALPPEPEAKKQRARLMAELGRKQTKASNEKKVAEIKSDTVG